MTSKVPQSISALRLLDYQEEAARKMAQTPYGQLLGFRMRLGKTITTIRALQLLQPRPRRVLLLVPPKSFHVWLEHMPPNWRPLFKILHGKTIRSAENPQQEFANSPFVISTVRTYIKYAHPNLYWDVIVIDEYHKYFRNRKTTSYKWFSKRTSPRNVRWKRLWLLSGSPIRKGVQDLWAPLHLIAPHEWTSYWRFVDEHCIVVRTPFGTEITGAKNIQRTIQATAKYIIRRKIDFKKRRSFLDVTLEQMQAEDPEQYRAYQELEQSMTLKVSPEEFIATMNTVSQFIALRKVLVCPELLGVRSLGLGFRAVIDNIRMRDDPRNIIFVPFKEATRIFSRWIETELGIPTIRLHSGLTPNQLQERIDTFNRLNAEYRTSQGPQNEDPVTGCICLCTTQFAEAFSLKEATACYFLGIESSPDILEQAEARMYSLDSQHVEKHTFFVRYKGTVEENLWAYLIQRGRISKDLYDA